MIRKVKIANINNIFITKKGFTLIEVVIASSLFVFLIILSVSTMSFFRNIFIKSDSKGWQVQQAETFLLKASHEIREASSISKPDFGYRGNVLEFNKLDGEEISYSISPEGVLSREVVGSHKKKIVIQNLSSLFFTRCDMNSIGVELCIGAKPRGEYKIITSFYGRNIKP